MNLGATGCRTSGSGNVPLIGRCDILSRHKFKSDSAAGSPISRNGPPGGRPLPYMAASFFETALESWKFPHISRFTSPLPPLPSVSASVFRRCLRGTKKGASRGGGWGECPPGKLPRKKIWRRATLPPPSEAVPSPRRVLTSVFGMGTGMAPAPWPPEKGSIRYRLRSESELEAGHQDGGPVRASSLRARSGGPEEMAKPRGRLVAVS